MRYWFDTEFIEDGKTIDLISIGIVAEDGREYYAVSSEFEFNNASDWVMDWVLAPMGIYQNINTINLSDPSVSSLTKSTVLLSKTRQIIRDEVINFCNPLKYSKPELWAYYADYDWVVFCQLFGTMMDLPDGFPMYCLDLKQEIYLLGDIEVPKQTVGEHDALEDARWVKATWEYIQNKKSSM